VRRVATRHIKAMIDLIARQSPDWGQPGAHERALVTLSTMVGAVLLARAVDEPGLSDSLREAALKSGKVDAATFDRVVNPQNLVGAGIAGA
jgi:fumarate hydratase class II